MSLLFLVSQILLLNLTLITPLPTWKNLEQAEKVKADRVKNIQAKNVLSLGLLIVGVRGGQKVRGQSTLLVRLEEILVGNLKEMQSWLMGGGEVGGPTTLLVRFEEVLVEKVKGVESRAMEGVEAEGWETLVRWLVSDGQLTEM
jgi:hypothetical protein